MFRRFALLSGLGAALAGCVSEGPFPSLAPREGEQLSIEEPLRETIEVASDSGLRSRILELRQQAARGERAFDVAHAPAETAVASAGAPGSDSWIESQQAISRLEAARGETMQALAELDRLASGRADMPTSGDDIEALTGIMAVVQDIADRQQARIDRLRR